MGANVEPCRQDRPSRSGCQSTPARSERNALSPDPLTRGVRYVRRVLAPETRPVDEPRSARSARSEPRDRRVADGASWTTRHGRDDTITGAGCIAAGARRSSRRAGPCVLPPSQGTVFKSIDILRETAPNPTNIYRNPGGHKVLPTRTAGRDVDRNRRPRRPPASPARLWCHDATSDVSGPTDRPLSGSPRPPSPTRRGRWGSSGRRRPHRYPHRRPHRRPGRRPHRRRAARD